MTVEEPMARESGGPAQTAVSPTTAAGMPAISTVASPGPAIGPPTWGTVPVTSGQTCMSVSRAAGGMDSGLPQLIITTAPLTVVWPLASSVADAEPLTVADALAWTS